MGATKIVLAYVVLRLHFDYFQTGPRFTNQRGLGGGGVLEHHIVSPGRSRAKRIINTDHNHGGERRNAPKIS